MYKTFRSIILSFIIALAVSGCFGSSIQVSQNDKGQEVYKLYFSSTDTKPGSRTQHWIYYDFIKVKDSNEMSIEVVNTYRPPTPGYGYTMGRPMQSLLDFTIVSSHQVLRPTHCSGKQMYLDHDIYRTRIKCNFKQEDFTKLQNADNLEYQIKYSTRSQLGTGTLQWCRQASLTQNEYNQCIAKYDSQMRSLNFFEEDHLDIIKKFAECTGKDDCNVKE